MFRGLLKKQAHSKRLCLISWHQRGAHSDDIIHITTKMLFEEAARRKNLSLEWVSQEQADLVIVGGGTILGVDSMRLYKRLEGLKTPLVFFGGGFRREKRDIGPEHTKRMEELFQKALLKGVRGYLSQQFFVQIGIEDSEVIGDPAIMFEPLKVESLKGEFKVGVSIRSMGKTGEFQYTDNQTNAKNFARICDYLVEEYKAKLYFFDLTENTQDSDAEGIEAVISQMHYKDGHTTIAFQRTPEDIFSLLGQMGYIVSQRLHPTIIGWAQGIGHIAFEYQFGKTDDFMQSIGMGEFVMRTDEFDMELYKKKFIRLLRENDTVVSQAKKSLDYWKRKQKDFTERCLSIVS